MIRNSEDEQIYLSIIYSVWQLKYDLTNNININMYKRLNNIENHAQTKRT